MTKISYIAFDGTRFDVDAENGSTVMENAIRNAVPARWTARVDELRDLAKGAPISLGAFLDASGLELEELYAGGRSWSDLCEAAGLPVQAAGPHEEALRRACGRMLHIDDTVRTKQKGSG